MHEARSSSAISEELSKEVGRKRPQPRHANLIESIELPAHVELSAAPTVRVQIFPADMYLQSLNSLNRSLHSVPYSFYIVDRGSAHVAKRTKASVKTLGGKLELFYLPPYSPDRNSDELVWKHLKADPAGRMVVTDKDEFESNVVSSMRSLQKHPEKIRAFYQKPSLKYPAWMSVYL